MIVPMKKISLVVMGDKKRGIAILKADEFYSLMEDKINE